MKKIIELKANFITREGDGLRNGRGAQVNQANPGVCMASGQPVTITDPSRLLAYTEDMANDRLKDFRAGLNDVWIMSIRDFHNCFDWPFSGHYDDLPKKMRDRYESSNAVVYICPDGDCIII